MSILILCCFNVGFRKSIFDGLNRNSKQKLYVALGQKLSLSLDCNPDDSRKFSPLSKVEGKALQSS